MSNYAETVSSSTIVPITPVSSPSSYAIGTLDPAQIMPLQAHLSTGDECSLLLPAHLPSSILAHPVFKDGYKWGYLEGYPEEEEWTVSKLVNEVCAILSELCDDPDPDFCPWTLGFLLGELASVAERDRTFALTGLAHYCFLLSFISLDPPSWPFYSLIRARWSHNTALKAYRVQGKSFLEAQRLALVA